MYKNETMRMDVEVFPLSIVHVKTPDIPKFIRIMDTDTADLVRLDYEKYDNYDKKNMMMVVVVVVKILRI